MMWFPLTMIAGGVVTVVIWALLRSRSRQATVLRRELAERANRIAAEYPDEIQAWGGKKVLLNIDVLRELIASLEGDLPPQVQR
jgi:hypothetical protein